MQQQNAFSSAVSVTPPALPKGGGALTGMGESLGQAGPTGVASMSLPLPITSGRGFAPGLTLNYSSGSGNSTFGVGWFCETMRISRRTSHGVPQYDESDEFIGPDGEVLVISTDSNEDPNPTTRTAYGDVTLSQSYTVTRYQPRIEGAFHRLEYWLGDVNKDNFWLLHDSSGNVHLFGKTTAARISLSQDGLQTAQWLLEESLNPTGEHVYYSYLAENSDGLSDGERDCSAMRYLSQVQYGNKAPAADLYLWNKETPGTDWYFTLLFDYGERGVDPQTPPAFTSSATWPVRQDPYSRYDYGFEIRVYRLCRQILMFHHFSDELGESDTLVSRLLLEYDESPALTQLTAAQMLAYETDGYVQSMPPLELRYSQPDPLSQAGWQQLQTLSGLELDSWPYTLVDLYGEGVPGVLYRTGNAWLYRAPQRGDDGGDSVTYAEWETLDSVPTMQNGAARLMDINGDGQLDWVVAQPGMAGFFTQRPDKSWSGFTPFSALPTEFFHPQAQFAELVGSGLADLALIGPTSVRFYANEGEGFSMGLDVTQQDIQLPIPGRDARELVVFADMLGSGQAHLCRIRYNEVTCWPNLGRGRFGSPVSLTLPAVDGLDESTFNPEAVLLADTDGSGAPDIIYMQHDRVQIWLNQGGNGFVAEEALLLPDGVFYDRLCQATVADLGGTGMAELVLSVPYMTPAHWRYPFNNTKPYLLSGVNNNLGASHTLCYRSSAQSWLDEKKANADAVPAPVPALPFAIQLLVQTITLDEITGNQLSQSYRYYQGVYDGREREFRGFGYVETEDTNNDALPAGDNTPLAATLLTKSWYHCGREEDENTLYGACWSKDSEAITLRPMLITSYVDGSDRDLNDLEKDCIWWLYRSLKGTLLRSETWANEGSDGDKAPYVCTQQRMRVRLMQAGDMPIVLPLGLEQVTSSYEELMDDPFVVQQVNLIQDKFGTVLQQASVAYPRRAAHSLSPYPTNLPADAWDNTYDEQQQKLRLTESRASVIHLTDPQAWRLGLPDKLRSNQLVYDSVPAEGISYETLSDADGLLADTQTRYLAAQNEVIYVTTPPDLRALVDHQRTAVLDNTALAAYDDIDIPSDYSWDRLGYVQVPTVLYVSDEAPLWAVEHSFTLYNDASAFYAPSSVQSTQLTSAITYGYDAGTLCVTSQSDSRNTSTAAYDYRFLAPWQTIDINANTREVQLNALGQAMGGSVYGSENGGQKVGFGMVSDFAVDPALSVEEAINAAIVPGYIQQLASISVSDSFSWMGSVAESDADTAMDGGWSYLRDNRFITFDGHIRPAGRQWAQSNPDDPLAALLTESEQVPVHSAVLTADNYPDTTDPDDPSRLLQQTAIAVTYNDGFGRALQQCALVPDGKAWHREEGGEVDTTEVDAAPRWAISGRVEYDNKGQVVRSYQPYFLDSWLYVTDASMRTQGYSDTLYYDALGRNIRTVTAKGYLRRNTWYSWFTVAEDENDTAGLPEEIYP